MDKKTPPEYGSVIRVLLKTLIITALTTIKTYFFSYIPLFRTPDVNYTLILYCVQLFFKKTIAQSPYHGCLLP